MRILFIGDIVGRPGRSVVKELLPDLRASLRLDFIVANGENAAGGLGATSDTLRELLEAGVDIITLGNHTWRKKELAAAIGRMDSVLRPANYPEGVPGRSWGVFERGGGLRLGVVCALGRVYMDPVDCPFRAVERGIAFLRETAPVVLVDFHAEATAEKVAMGWFADGRCTAVVGTHTHVQTADERILPRGTAYITDVGMTGPFDSVIGMEREPIVKKFLTGMPTEFRVARDRVGLSAVLIEADDASGKAVAIERIVRWQDSAARDR